jgi:hypothetical protein
MCVLIYERIQMQIWYKELELQDVVYQVVPDPHRCHHLLYTGRVVPPP